jgi:hypothetical protein
MPAAIADPNKQTIMRFVRISPPLDQQIEVVAMRDCNSSSTTIRRLVALRLRVESEAERERRRG